MCKFYKQGKTNTNINEKQAEKIKLKKNQKLFIIWPKNWVLPKNSKMFFHFPFMYFQMRPNFILRNTGIPLTPCGYPCNNPNKYLIYAAASHLPI